MCDCGSFCGGVTCAFGTCFCTILTFHIKDMLYDPNQPFITQLFGYTVETQNTEPDDGIYRRIISEGFPSTHNTSNNVPNISSISSISEHVTNVNVNGRYDNINEEEKNNSDNNNDDEIKQKFTIT